MHSGAAKLGRPMGCRAPNTEQVQHVAATPAVFAATLDPVKGGCRLSSPELINEVDFSESLAAKAAVESGC